MKENLVIWKLENEGYVKELLKLPLHVYSYKRLEEILSKYRVYEYIIIDGVLMLSTTLVKNLPEFNAHMGYFIIEKEKEFYDECVESALSSIYNIGYSILFRFIGKDEVYKIKGLGSLSNLSSWESHEVKFFDPKPFVVTEDFSVTTRNGYNYVSGQKNSYENPNVRIMSSEPIRGRVTILVVNRNYEEYQVPQEFANVVYLSLIEKYNGNNKL